MSVTSWILIALACLPVVVGAWWCCCSQSSNCTTVLDGWCFQFSISGVGNLVTVGGGPPCASCADYNGTWLLVPSGPISTAAGAGCVWHTCRPPVCCGYPSPITGPGYRFTLSALTDKNGAVKRWQIKDDCNANLYVLNSPFLSTGSNTFTSNSPGGIGANCQYWPATITVTGIAPTARATQTKTAQSFTTAPIYPIQNSPSPWVIAPGTLYNNNAAITEWLICYNFGFTIPSSAWVTGISVQFKRWADQASAVSDNEVVIGPINNIETGFLNNIETFPGTWPLFNAGQGLASYGGQFDQWGLGGEVSLATTVIDTLSFAFAVSANSLQMTTGAAHIDPTTCQMTIYYVSVPCQDNCCACPPEASTGLPPRAYTVTFPYINANCDSANSPNPDVPGCDCGFVSGATFEMPYSALLSIPTYTCVYTLTVGYWTFTLTISNISPDVRQFVFTGGTDAGGPCALEGEQSAGRFFQGGAQSEGPNLAISSCVGAELFVDDTFNCFCDLVITIGGPSGEGIFLAVSPIT